MRWRAGIIALSVMIGGAGVAHSYPDRPVTIILSLGAGTGMDTTVRLYADRLSRKFGQPFVIENRPGGSQAIATLFVAKAAPDGYTLLVATSGAMAINPALFKQIKYNPERDFVPVALYVKAPFILIADPALPFRSVSELINQAKSAKAPLTYSSVGPGSPQHLSMELTKQRFGLDLTHVPYRSSGQAVSDTIAGHVNVGFADAGSSLSAARDGKVRALAVSSLMRFPALPDVPTFAEASATPGFETVSWHALFAPAGTPDEIVSQLHQAMKEILADPAVKQAMINVGLIPIDMPTIEGTREYIKSEQEKWGSLVRKLGLQGSQ